MTINEKGEVEAVDFRRSSGWWLLDQATAKALIGCKLLDQPPAKKIIAATRYSWNLEEKLRYDNDPVIRPETCPNPTKCVWPVKRKADWALWSVRWCHAKVR
jgi:hypothetical protein